MNDTAATGMPTAPPLVSVAMTAYNSARWLPRALESVLRQQTSFPFEIVIGDDCSQDNTVQVANSYAERHPGKIRVIARSKNLGIQRNYYETFEECRGKYIAWLDSDDAWTDPEKLAIQAEVLEKDPSVSMCCHFIRWVTHEGEVKKDRWPYLPAGRYGVEQVIHYNFVSSPTPLFRNGIHRNLPDWYFDVAPLTDWPIWLMCALSGDIVLLDRIMADYTLTPGSTMTSKGMLFLNQMETVFYDHIESILPAKWHRLIRAEKSLRYDWIAYAVRQQGDFIGSRQAAVKAFCSPHILDRVGSKTKGLVAAVVREAEWRLKGGDTRKLKAASPRNGSAEGNS